MTVMNAVLLALGVLVLLAVVCMAVVFLEKRFPGKEYDERQKLIQGKAYGFASMISTLYFLGFFAYLELGNESHLETPTILSIGLILQALSYHIYCMVENAGLPLKSKGKLLMAVYAFSSVAHFNSFRNQRKYLRIYDSYVELEPTTTLPDPGSGESAWLTLILAIAFAAMAVIYLIAWIREDSD